MRTMDQMEGVYKKNSSTPVVLVCRSLGSKVGHYCLNFAKKTRGQEWLGRYVHTYMPVNGAHLGTPNSLRSTVSGDKMSRHVLSSAIEALVFERSLGSGPFLIPAELPHDAPSAVYLRGDGAIKVTITESIDSDLFLFNREEEHRPGKLKLTVVFDKSGVSTPFAPIEADQRVTFGEVFTFRTRADGPPPKASLAILLCEPGVHLVRRSKAEFLERRKTWFNKFFGPWICDCG